MHRTEITEQRFAAGCRGYAAAVGFVVETRPENWHRSRLYRVLTLGGYVAFDLPRAVAGLGATLLLGVGATHLYVLGSQANLPAYFVVYAVVVSVACALGAGGIALGRVPLVARTGWFFGSMLSVVVLGLDVGTRLASLPGLVAVTGRWDFAPATFAGAFAGVFIALHISVLLGINVAYPERHHWED